MCKFFSTFAAVFANMWTILAFISALCLGFYDVSKKIALTNYKVIDVLTLSVCFSSIFLSIPLILSRLCPGIMCGTHFYVPTMDLQAHLFTILKSAIVLSSWVFAYISLKHLPISVVSPMQATRPMWTLVGALLIFGERLNTWQWIGVILAIGTVFVFSLGATKTTNHPALFKEHKFYYLCLALAILIGSCSGLYDKYLMRRYDHNAVQVYYTFYQAIMMLIVWGIDRFAKRQKTASLKDKRLNTLADTNQSIVHCPSSIVPIILISIFLIISDNVYMLALRDPDSMIAVVSTIRRGGAVIGFAYGLLFLRENDPWRKVLCMLGILVGLICLAFGSI